jgi:hypothetical protein
MMHTRRILGPGLIVVLVGTLLVSGASIAIAQPSNDDIANATAFAALPFSNGPVDTTDATTAPNDPDCVGNGPTVWYAFTPSDDVRAGIDTFGSDYDTTLSAYTGSPANLTQVACNDDAPGTLQSAIAFDATAGVTYFIMVGAFDSGPGGTLFLHADVAPPPLEIDLMVDRFGSVTPKTGVATVRGTISCTNNAAFFIAGELEQRIGRVLLQGSFSTEGTCTAPSSSWSAEVTAFNGLYVGGRATVTADASACDEFTCDFISIGPVRTILRGRH